VRRREADFRSRAGVNVEEEELVAFGADDGVAAVEPGLVNGGGGRGGERRRRRLRESFVFFFFSKKGRGVERMSNEPSPRARDSKEERAHSDSLCARFSPSISLLLS
jgi:hypothetical protein